MTKVADQGDLALNAMRCAKHERNCWWEVGYTRHGPSTERRFPDMWTSYWDQLGALQRALHTTPHATLKYMYGSGDLRASGILRCTGSSSLSLSVIKSGVFSRIQKKVTESDDSFTCKIALQISLLARGVWFRSSICTQTEYRYHHST